MSNSNTPKVKRSAISLETKILILDRLANGEGSSAIGKAFNLGESTIRTIKKNEEAIRKSVLSGTNLCAKFSSYSRDNLIVQTERALIMWIEESNKKNIPLDGQLIKQRALNFYEQLRESEPSISTNKFSASAGWLHGFLKRNSLNNLRVKNEITPADEETAIKYPEQLAKIIYDRGYYSDQVFNANDFELFWKKIPKRAYIPQFQKNSTSKHRITILLCTNACGDKILKPLVVNRTIRPRALKGKDLKKLPVHWMANLTGWKDIITQWFHEYFVPEVELYLTLKALPFKVLLILDNDLNYITLEHPNIEIVYLPPNTTNLLMPLNQGIISTFKKYYLKHLFQNILNKLNSESLGFIEIWKKINILDCLNYLDLAIGDLKPHTLNECWNTVWPACVYTNNYESFEITNITTEIINIAKEIGGEGFENFCENDLEEMLTEKTLTDEEILDVITNEEPKIHEDYNVQKYNKFDAKIIGAGIQLANKLENFFLVNDNDRERALKFQKDLQETMSVYRELYKTLTNPSQSLITDYFTRIKSPSKIASETNEMLNFIDEIVSPPKKKKTRHLSKSNN